MQLINGHRLQEGKYRIEKKIGQGGFGITYLARWYQKLQGEMGIANSYSMVVIKEFFWSKYCNRGADGFTVSISSAEGKEMMAQFKEKLKKEGKIISKLSHPNIVRILNIFEENNTAYLVMEYIEGESLSDIIKNLGRIDEQTALRYTEQICSALSEIHSKRILHLDIKPSNVLIDENDIVQIIDFGISKQYDETSHETSDTPIGISAGYSPIEQYGTLKSFSPPTDIYALGATLYKMLTGETPIEATDRNQFDLEPVTHFCPSINQKTEGAITKAMSEKVRDRYQTAQEFWESLIKKEETPVNEKNDDITVIDKPEKEIIIENDTQIEKLSIKVEEPPKPQIPLSPRKPIVSPSSPNTDPEPSNIWKKIMVGVGVAAVVFAVILYFKISNTTTEINSQGNTQVQTNNTTPTSGTPGTVVEETKPNQSQQSVQAIQQPVTQTSSNNDENDSAKKAEENRQKAIRLVQQANLSFNNSSLGVSRYEQSLKLYLEAKNLKGDVSTGYNNFLSKAKSLIGNGSGFDANVKKMLQYAQQLNNTQEVRELLVKCN